MSSLRSPLHDIRVASPCRASWEKMEGNERVRFCNDCALHVYNLSVMTAQEAESLVVKKEGRLCVRLYQREDGTVMTQDCPRGLIALRRAARRTTLAIGAGFAAMFLLLFGLFATALGLSGRGNSNASPFKPLNGWFTGGSSSGTPVMGAVCPVEKECPLPLAPDGEDPQH
jgi:hypothetical protein